MDNFHEAVRWVHILLGFLGLATFWLPVFMRKGGRHHIFFGRIFLYCGYVVLISAMIGVALSVLELQQRGIGIADRPETYAFLFFLAYLALVTLTMIRHAVGVLRTKKNPKALRTPVNVGSAWASIAASAAIVGYALVVSPENRILLFALSPIGVGNGIGILRYLTQPPRSPKQWMYEHLGGMLGAGIAFHTAFAVFGSGRIFDLDLTGWVQVVPWVLPAAIGIPATAIWTRHYRAKFGEIPKPSPA